MRRSDRFELGTSRPHAGPSSAARIVAWLFVVLGVAGWLATPAHATTLPLSPSDYPPHTQLTYFPTWTNEQFDCNFGWFCEINLPFLHLSTEDELHRVAGWAVWGEWRNDRMGFELYSSVYSDQPAPDGIAWNRHAATDERVALGLQQARAAKTVASVLPPGVQGEVFAASLNRPYWHVLFLTAWWGPTHEIEAAVLYPLKKKHEAWRYLTEQVRAALQVADGHAPVLPSLFVCRPQDFPPASRIVARVEPNRRIHADHILHFGRSFTKEGRLTGYFMDAIEGSSSFPRVDTSYLVSIFPSAALATAAFREQRYYGDAVTGHGANPVPLQSGAYGPPGSQGLYTYLAPTGQRITELLFHRGPVLIEVFQQFNIERPSQAEIRSFFAIARELDTITVKAL